MPAAYELRESGKEHRITVVNASETFQFIPLIHGSLWGGGNDPRPHFLSGPISRKGIFPKHRP